MPTEIWTSRLRLRQFTAADVDPLLAILGDAETMRWYRAPFDRARVVSWVQANIESYGRNGFGLLAIEARDGREFLGDCGPTIQGVDGTEHVELGWHVRRDKWGQGIATEAGVAARDWCWANLEIDHLISIIRPENRQSGRVAEKLGLTVWQETMRHDLRHCVYRKDRPAS